VSEKRDLTKDDRSLLIRLGIQPVSSFVVASCRSGLLFLLLVQGVFFPFSIWEEWKANEYRSFKCQKEFFTIFNATINGLRRPVNSDRIGYCVNHHIEIISGLGNKSNQKIYGYIPDISSRLVALTFLSIYDTTVKSTKTSVSQALFSSVLIPIFLVIVVSLLTNLIMMGLRFSHFRLSRRYSEDFSRGARIISLITLVLSSCFLLWLFAVQMPQIMSAIFSMAINGHLLSSKNQNGVGIVRNFGVVLILLGLFVAVLTQLRYYFRYKARMAVILKKIKSSH
jgi:hypothetical protein